MLTAYLRGGATGVSAELDSMAMASHAKMLMNAWKELTLPVMLMLGARTTEVPILVAVMLDIEEMGSLVKRFLRPMVPLCLGRVCL